MSDSKPKMNALFGGETGQGFLGIPVVSPANTEDADIVIIGAPSATPYQSVGPYCAAAPDAIRSAFGWPGALQHYDFDIQGKILADDVQAVDWGNLSFDQIDFASNRDTIQRHVSMVLDSGAVPIVLGGDDSIPIPVLQAYEKHGPLTVFQLDAHIDWRHEVSGERMGLSSNMRRASEMGWVKNIIQVGARGIGSARPADFQDALDWGVKFFPMASIFEQGIDRILQAVPENLPLFVTLDIDVMDPAIVPSVIGPAPGGLDYWQVVKLLKGLAGRSRLAGFDLVELMPANDVGARGALVAARLVAIMLGLVSRQISGE